MLRRKSELGWYDIVMDGIDEVALEGLDGNARMVYMEW